MTGETMQDSQKRPTGVTILGILVTIIGILYILAGMLLITAGSLLITLPVNLEGTGLQLFGIMALIFQLSGGIALVISIAFMIVAYGTAKAKEWAWISLVILSFVSIGTSLIEIALTSEASGSAIFIGLNAIILYYLYRPNVKAYFGRAVKPPPPASTA